MNQTTIESFGGIREALGATGFGVVLFLLVTFAFVVWAMWVIFPLVVYYQLRGIRDQMRQIYGSLVEANHQLSAVEAVSKVDAVHGR